jgi:polyhydroxybutyrate depolymerase
MNLLRVHSILLGVALLAAGPVWAQPGEAGLRERIPQRLEARRVDADGQVASPREPLRPGTHTLHIDHGGQRRRVLLHIPAGLDATRPAALVVALHGGGGHAEHMADGQRYGLVGKADREGFVVAFPNGYSRFPGGRLATWNAGGCCGEARDRQVDDVGFLRAVVAEVRARVPIDGERVFATGMSNGGMMSHRLACEAADLFRAVASVAGTEAVAVCQPQRPVSVLHIHARDDTHVLFGGGAGPQAFRDTSKVMDFVSVPDTVAHWVQRSRCQPQPQRTLDRPGAYCEAYAGCAGGASVQLCVTDRGGHSWPGAGSVRRGKPAASTALSANDVIWDFFRASAAR